MKIINKTYKIKSLDRHIQENKRIVEILKNSEGITFSNKEIATLIPETIGIKSEIERLQNEEAELKNSVETISTRKDDIQQEISQNQGQLNSLRIELENLSKTKEEELLKIKSGLENEIVQLQDKRNNIEIEIKTEKENKSKELEFLKQEYEQLQKEHNDLVYTVTELKQENRRTQRDAQQELID